MSVPNKFIYFAKGRDEMQIQAVRYNFLFLAALAFSSSYFYLLLLLVL